MSTYTQFLYQIVFSTKDRNPSLAKSNREHLFKYFWGILKNKDCHLYRINGVEDHLHIITHVHPTVTISTLVKDLKTSSNKFIRKEKLFPKFRGWQNGYGAFSYSISAKARLIEYVKNQEEHHKSVTFREEYLALLKEHNVDFDERYLF